jgi:hypothetical protein
MNAKLTPTNTVVLIVFITGLFLAFWLPGRRKAADEDRTATCQDNLTRIIASTEAWAIKNDKRLGEPVDKKAIVAVFPGGRPPACPKGGTYKVPSLGKNPTCSVHGDLLEAVDWQWSSKLSGGE